MLCLFMNEKFSVSKLYYHAVIVMFSGGGYVITPLNNGKQSVVKHMLAIDWKMWAAYLLPSLARSTTICMLGRISGMGLGISTFFIRYRPYFQYVLEICVYSFKGIFQNKGG